MASMRDAMKRLELIYESCAPEAAEAAAAEKGLDEFSKLKRRVHTDVKACRLALKDREEMLARQGTTAETAEAAYRIRVMIRTLKESTTRMDEIIQKDERKKKKKITDEEINIRKETLDLCRQHIDELENLEKRRFLEQQGVDRSDLFAGSDPSGPRANADRRAYGVRDTSNDRQALFEGAAGGGKKKKKDQLELDPFLNTNLPDIDEDIQQDLTKMNKKNEEIDQEIDAIGEGVKKLKDIALDMNQELDNQHKALDNLERNVDNALDGLDNVNIKMKNMLDKAMKGDKFMINCILVCVFLALIGFIASLVIP